MVGRVRRLNLILQQDRRPSNAFEFDFAAE